MDIAAAYSFKGGDEFIRERFGGLLSEVEKAIAAVDASALKTKESREKTMPGRMLYSPQRLNKAFAAQLAMKAWRTVRIRCNYPTEFYSPLYRPRSRVAGAFREMDFIKEKLGIEVQFGKYAFMVYNVCAKMTIFHNMGLIDAGIEIVPVKEFADQMSTGVSFFEQVVWDLEARGVADIDLPVLILGLHSS